MQSLFARNTQLRCFTGQEQEQKQGQRGRGEGGGGGGATAAGAIGGGGAKSSPEAYLTVAMEDLSDARAKILSPSVRDEGVVSAAIRSFEAKDEENLAMIFTGIRHFNH